MKELYSSRIVPQLADLARLAGVPPVDDVDRLCEVMQADSRAEQLAIEPNLLFPPSVGSPLVLTRAGLIDAAGRIARLVHPGDCSPDQLPDVSMTVRHGYFRVMALLKIADRRVILPRLCGVAQTMLDARIRATVLKPPTPFVRLAALLPMTPGFEPEDVGMMLSLARLPSDPEFLFKVVKETSNA